MKAGDLVRLPQELGYGIILRLVKHNPDIRNPHGSTSIAVLHEGNEDYWDADACMVINESR